MLDLLIRTMKKQDVEAVYELNCHVFPQPWPKDSYLNDIAEKPKASVHVAYHKNDFTGYASCFRVGNEAELLQLAVVPDWRRLGIAGKLLNHVSGGLIKKGVDIIHLEVGSSNYTAQYLYRKHGFLAVGKRLNYYAVDSEDALLMRKHLKEG